MLARESGGGACPSGTPATGICSARGTRFELLSSSRRPPRHRNRRPGDYPIYVIAIMGLTSEQSLAGRFGDGIEVTDGGSGIRFRPSESDFNLERDFGVMLDALAGFFEECARQ